MVSIQNDSFVRRPLMENIEHVQLGTIAPRINISRNVCTTAECRGAASYEKLHADAKTRIRKAIHKTCSCTADDVKKRVLGFLPFISVLKSYEWKEWILSDLIAGISVGVIHIPQGMGFAMLTSVPAVYGLYSSFFPVILYFLFGTSRHISFGTMAVISLLVGSVVDSEAMRLGVDYAANQTASSALDAESIKVGVACAVSLLAGIMQIAMGMLHLGVVASFMSMSFIGGFMAGAAMHITTSQLPNLLGLRLQRISGTAKIPRVIIDVFRNLPSINAAELITAFVCVGLLLSLKLVNERLRNRGIKIPIPAELLVVVMSIVVSYFADLHQRFNVRIVGHIPTGIPTPEIPLMENCVSYIGDAIVIAVVSFAISISMAKIFTRKHRYEINANQELLAYGMAHAVSSFFHCFAGAQAPPRSLVHEGTGGHTQVASLFSSALVLLVCLVAAPLFKPLPLGTLAAVIVIALVPLFVSFRDLQHLWRSNRYDAIVWFITWAVVTFVGIITGLGVGIAISILTVIAQSRLSQGETIGRIDCPVGCGVYAPLKLYRQAKPITNVHIFYYPSVLYFANVDNFKQQLYAATVNPNHSCQQKGVSIKVKQDTIKDTISNQTKTSDSKIDIEAKSSTQLSPYQTVIVDCSAMTYIDVMGLNALKQIASDYAAIGVNFVLCCCCESLLDKLHVADIAKEDGTAHTGIYPTLDDAVAAMTF